MFTLTQNERYLIPDLNKSLKMNYLKVCCDFNIFVRKYQDAVAQKVIEFN